MIPTLDALQADSCGIDAKHKLCRSRGGESCAFDGAAIVLMPIADAAHVVHGPIACCGNAWEGRGVRSSAGDMHRRGFSSDLSELDIVYGGEERLAATVRDVVLREEPSAVFVYATCVTGLTGEDLDAVCSSLSDELNVPVIPVDAPGFVGPKNLGNRIAGEVLLQHVIGTAEPVCETPTDITLVGEYNVAGDLDLIEPLLRECGVRVLSRITGNARFDEIRWAHRAKVSAVVCSRALVNVSSSLWRRWGVPAVEVSFFGATETARSLRSIAAALETVSPEALGVAARVESVVARREAWLAQALEPYSAIRGKRAVLYSGGVKSWSMASALRDLGIEVIAVGTKKSSHEDEEKVREVLGPDVPLLEDISPAVVRRSFAEGAAELLVAGGRNRYLAAKEGWPFIDVNQEREHAYAGYEGLVALARDLDASLRFYAARQPLIAQQHVIGRSAERLGAVDPLKNAPTTGAVLALQGFDGALPALHSAQGCSFLSKVLLIRHFNEPIAAATTKLFAEEVVLGADEAAVAFVRSYAAKAPADRPALVALVAGALSAVKGDDIEALALELQAYVPFPVVSVSAPDYAGGLEEGYAAAVSAVAALARDTDGPADPHRVAVLAGAHLTPADVLWLREVIEAFGLATTFLPDLGALDGSREHFSPLASGGTSVDEVLSLGRCGYVIAIGASLEPLAQALHKRFGCAYTIFPSVHGQAGTDALLETLVRLSGRDMPFRFARQRRALVDAMRDAHLELSGAAVTLAVEPDHAVSLVSLLSEVRADVHAIVPTPASSAARIPCVTVGDFASVPVRTELLLAGSHGQRTAEKIGAAHVEMGFPVFRAYGAIRRRTLGYDGAAALVDELANALAARERSGHRVILDRKEPFDESRVRYHLG
ncbi:MAG: nitrogenase component 1 [Coriobacteriia bacterium]